MAGRPTKPRVLLPFVGDSVGGSYKVAVGLFKALRALRNSPVEPVVALHRRGVLADYLDRQGVPYRLLPRPDVLTQRKPRRVARQFLRLAPPLAWFLVRHGIDIVHSNDIRMNYTWTVPTRLARRRHLLHLRVVFDDIQAGVPPVYRRLMAKADAVICDSDFVRANLGAEFAAADLHTIRSPIDWERTPPPPAQARTALRNLLGVPAETTVIGYFSNLLERKRPRIFVETAIRLARARPESLVFVMFGDDREGFGEPLRRCAEQGGIEASLHLMGFADPVEPLMAGCDLMIAPAVREPLGLTLMEGCLAGTPVIAADDGGHREIYGPVAPAWLAEADDPDALARAAGAVLDDPEGNRAVLARAREDLRRRFSMPTYTAAVAEVYRKLLH